MSAGAKDPRRQFIGLISRARGKQFEENITNALDYYESIGFVKVEKTPEPMKILKSLGNGRFLACFEKQAQPDYKGAIAGGRSVIFEAKFTSSDRMEQDRVLEEQEKSLEKYSAMNALCFVVAGFSTGGVYRIPWAVWRDMRSHFGRKYITEADLGEYRVPISQAGFPKIFD